ncbi:biotin/lipoyl-binding protein, partial [Methylomonas koyamae]
MHGKTEEWLPDTRLKLLTDAITAPIAGKLARSLILLLIVLLFLLLLTPWQQNVRGIGRVVAYIPGDRQQTVGAPVEGRISRWLVKEGSKVKAGEVIAELRDNDPLLLQRLEGERQALLGRQTAIDNRVETFREQLRMAEQARPQALAAAESRLEMARQRQRQAVQGAEAASAARLTSSLNLTRQQTLQEKGLASRRTLELAQLEIAQRSADLDRAHAALA